MQKVKVKEVRGPLGRGEKKFYAVVSDDGAEFTSFDTKIASLLPGSVINLEPDIKGKYINIKEWTLLEEPAAQIPSPTTLPQATSRSLQFDARVTALTLANNLAGAGIITVDKVLPQAEVYQKWLIPGTKTDNKPVNSTKPQTTVKDDWDNLKRDDEPREQPRAKRNPDDIKNLGALFTACLQDFKMNPAAVAKELGYSNPQDISGNFADHYLTIAQTKGSQ